MTLGIGLRQGLAGWRFLVSEVALSNSCFTSPSSWRKGSNHGPPKMSAQNEQRGGQCPNSSRGETDLFLENICQQAGVTSFF